VLIQIVTKRKLLEIINGRKNLRKRNNQFQQQNYKKIIFKSAKINQTIRLLIQKIWKLQKLRFSSKREVNMANMEIDHRIFSLVNKAIFIKLNLRLSNNNFLKTLFNFLIILIIIYVNSCNNNSLLFFLLLLAFKEILKQGRPN